ncbi:unnamed protein product [Vitrella brassicaformis CCMP3155]|uniref:RCC1-like domain-containing protein n=1 Tax=Vitrella brassicaformis (strain CCMP3155) TaxID=1169540 RepID=A0A0G4FYL2_VITBC|nr:unnamed protein product [Vitrella brassicaformis CCMP3155]|eukprot:CEM20137.1 unnamed protein product [Vitrella brassicaformis CCMP3155]
MEAEPGGAAQLVPDVPAGVGGELAADTEKSPPDLFGPFTISRLACSLNHSLAIAHLPPNRLSKGDNPRQLFGWGQNPHNVLGTGIHNTHHELPTRIASFAVHPCFAVACGTYHTMLLCKKETDIGGRVYAFGLGNKGRLGFRKRREQHPEGLGITGLWGVGDDKYFGGTRGYEGEAEPPWFTPKPVKVRFPEGVMVARISCGSDHTLAISDAGSLYVWGLGRWGALGTGDTEDEWAPVRIGVGEGAEWRWRRGKKVAVGGERVVHCAGGPKHSLCVTEAGGVFAWGTGDDFRLGMNNLRTYLLPQKLSNDVLKDRAIVYVACGEAHSVCIDRSGNVFTWGSGAYARLGHGDEDDGVYPRLVQELKGIQIVQVACGAFHTLALSRHGQVYAWGCGLGMGLLEECDTRKVILPKRVTSFAGPVAAIASGSYHSMAILLNTNDIVCWGAAGQYRLGQGDHLSYAYPRPLGELRGTGDVSEAAPYIDPNPPPFSLPGAEEAPAAEAPEGEGEAEGPAMEPLLKPKQKLLYLTAGDKHNAALTSDGKLFMWGGGKDAQMGLGPSIRQNFPEPFHLEIFSRPLVRVACGGSHTLAVSEAGDVYAWGSGREGQLGIGVIRDAWDPVLISGLKNAIDVAAGLDYSAAIIHGNPEELHAAAAPSQEGGPPQPQQPAAAAAAGESFASGGAEWRLSGDLYMWGSADSGKLDLGLGVSSGVVVLPQRVCVPAPVSSVALGLCHTLAVCPTGELYAWGGGWFGRLGIGEMTNAFTPVKVHIPLRVRIKAAHVGDFHSCALSTRGDLFVFGRDRWVCMTEHVLSPMVFRYIKGDAGEEAVFVGVAVYGEHTLAATQDGRLWGWGDNSKGQLGLGGRAPKFVSPPQCVKSLKEPIQEVVTGKKHSLAITRMGVVYVWGDPSDGRLGIGIERGKTVTSPLQLHETFETEAKEPSTSRRQKRNSTTSVSERMMARSSFVIVLLQGLKPDEQLAWEGLQKGDDSVTFVVLQRIVKNEAPATRQEQLCWYQEDLIRLYAAHLSTLFTLGEGEAPLTNLHNKIEFQLNRNLGLLKGCPEGDFQASRTTPQELIESFTCST